MNAVEIIQKKRDGGELTQEEIAEFVRGVVDGSIADYQAAAWLMAVFLRGMTERETLDLALAMRDSGERVDLSDLPHHPTLDKHSTGGVGDKTTLVVVPMLAAAGVPILKMSGRGLGFSGGTIDKLESIPGFRTELTVEAAKEQVRQIGAALVGQSANLVPADKILYGLRDVTATVESIPLIAGSILSKKLAGGAERIVLDVKVGSGSFMKTLERGQALAQTLVTLGNRAGVPTSAVLTDMNEPLGFAVGNALEVREAIATLRNESLTEPRFRLLCIELTAHSLTSVGKAATLEEGRAQAEKLLASGAAARKFEEIVKAQGGPDGCDNILDTLPKAPQVHSVTAETSGVIAGLDAEAVGRLAMAMGAGREKKTDPIDLSVGIVLNSKTGTAVTTNTLIATLHLRESDAPHADAFAEALRTAYHIVPASEAPPQPAGPIIKILD